MEAKSRICPNVFSVRTLVILTVAGLCWGPTVSHGRQNSPKETIALLNAAIADYQQALSMDDAVQRKAAFGKVEIALSSLLNRKDSRDQQWSADLFVNWGNAAVQVNDMGTAILAYRKALLREPFHQQATQNLEYLRSKLPSWAQQKSSSESTWQRLFFWNLWLSPDQVKVLAAGSFAVACLLIGCSIYFRFSFLKMISLGPLVVWAVLLISIWLAEQSHPEQHLVFVAEETACHSADSENSVLSFDTMVPAGAEAIVLEERAEWIKVELGNKTRGWVPTSSVGLVD